MPIHGVIEYNDKGFLIYADQYPGAFSRGKDRSEALEKLPADVKLYCRWAGLPAPADTTVHVIQEEYRDIAIEDADSEVIFHSEAMPLGEDGYQRLKALAFQSARDVITVYNSVPDPDITNRPPRKTFHGDVPRTAREMLTHMNHITAYYIQQVGVSMDNGPDLLANRERAFALLEQTPDYLERGAAVGSFGEAWSLRKVLRRFIWHDRIHVRAMYRMAHALWPGQIDNPFYFSPR